MTPLALRLDLVNRPNVPAGKGPEMPIFPLPDGLLGFRVNDYAEGKPTAALP